MTHLKLFLCSLNIPGNTLPSPQAAIPVLKTKASPATCNRLEIITWFLYKVRSPVGYTSYHLYRTTGEPVLRLWSNS